MTAYKKNFTIEQGATFRHTFLWKDSEGIPYPLATESWVARMHIVDESGNVLVELTTENGRIVLSDLGEVDLEVKASVENGFNFEFGEYDIELENTETGYVKRLAQGIAIVDPEKTKE